MIDTGSQPTSVVERPPHWPARGLWEAPAWLIGALGVVVVLFGVLHWMSRRRRLRSLTPTTSVRTKP